MSKKHTTPTVPPLTLEQAHELIFKLMERISELEDRLNQNSGNSSKPPSSNGPGGAPPARPRKRSGKQRGAQPGHKGHRRERHPQDERVTLAPHYPSDTCTCCGGDMLAHAKPHRVHQVFDLPEVSYFMTEHQLFRATCTRCIHTDEARLPETVSHTQMGTNLLSYIALQSGQYHQSISQIQSQLKQHFGLRFSRGAISEAQGRVSAMLTPTYQAIKQQVQTAAHIHADETRHQRGGERRWMWLALSKVAVCFMTAFGRGQDAAQRLLGDVPDTSVLVTDQYAGYRFIDNGQRQLCWAHVARNVAAIADSSERTNHPIGARLVLLADTVFRTRHRWENGELEHAQYQRRLRRCRQSWQAQLKRGMVLCSSRYRGRCRWLLNDDDMLWTFLEDDQVALTNNEAERALRGYVLWRKGSYGVWSQRGEQFRQRILSLVETAKRLGRCPQEWLRAVVRACIEKTNYPIPEELCASSHSG
ncbi:IS66 family transposase ISH10B [Oceanisphaera marina]|uniref:IS66 family transposase ISH10B n=1 Tax=Oceanisphaera marina TaxID=2017550 RepID=A0ABQ1IY22_9GAMM|nr:IS66 family transposase [Oceanisphaera marina]GGB55254.1 IS66 family transposase ISH10B [Oceanisphaera marina]